MIARSLWLLAALLAAPLAHADDEACRMAVGRGWPPATENYGTAVETLFAAGAHPAWSFTLLPQHGAESGLVLIPGANGGDWNLRYAKADKRVHYWGPTQLELRTDQVPDVRERPMPAAVANRLIEGWRHALAAAAPEESTAPFSEKDTWLFVVGDADAQQTLRVSGSEPTCELGELLRDQIELLIKASDEGPEKRARRWERLGELLDRLREAADALSADATQ